MASSLARPSATGLEILYPLRWCEPKTRNLVAREAEEAQPFQDLFERPGLRLAIPHDGDFLAEEIRGCRRITE